MSPGASLLPANARQRAQATWAALAARERRLLALQQTKQLIHAHLTDTLQVAAGGASSRVYGSDVYPLADSRLVVLQGLRSGQGAIVNGHELDEPLP